ncbi:MAG TPA: hypothetical protein HPQ00_10455, partial [Magnetococcales bacterium]|nr:hypothetical protein [Magnetococcales bacterium]
MNSVDPAISLPKGEESFKSVAVGEGEIPPSFPLVHYFSLTSFLAMILVGSALGWFLHRMQIENLLHMGERQNVALTRAFANSLWPLLKGFLREDARLGSDEILVHSMLASLDYTVKHLVRDLDVVKVKLYDRQGITIYSTNATDMGQSQKHNPGFLAALAGGVKSQLVFRQQFSSWDGVVEDRDLISSYIPLYHGNAIQGVLELYYDVSTSISELSQVRNHAIVFLGGAFLVLYLILFF